MIVNWHYSGEVYLHHCLPGVLSVLLRSAGPDLDLVQLDTIQIAHHATDEFFVREPILLQDLPDGGLPNLRKCRSESAH